MYPHLGRRASGEWAHLPLLKRALLRTLKPMLKPAPIVETVLALADRLRTDADLLSALESQVASSSGLHPCSLRRLVELWLDGLNRQALGRLASVAAASRPAGRVAIVAPGNLCVATWQAMVEALVCGNRVLVRPGRGDPHAAGNLQRVLALVEEDRSESDLAERIEVLAFSRDDETGWRDLLARSDALMIYGGDAAVDAVVTQAATAGFVGPTRRHGHGVSLGLLPASVATSDDRLKMLAPAIAHDTLLADGRGCLSLRALLIEGDLDAERWQRIGDILAEAFTQAAARWPAGKIAIDMLAARRIRVEEAGFLAANGHGLFRQDPAGGWALISDPAAAPDRSLTLSDLGPGARCLVLLPLSERRQLQPMLRSLAPWLSGLARPESQGPALDALATEAGFDRSCSFGDLHRPEADQPTDGVRAGTGLLAQDLYSG